MRGTLSLSKSKTTANFSEVNNSGAASAADGSKGAVAGNIKKTTLDAADMIKSEIAKRRQEALLDEAIKETFPASDSTSPMVAPKF